MRFVTAHFRAQYLVPRPAEVVPVLDALISHAKALSHPAFAHLSYDSRRTQLHFTESAAPKT